MAEQNVKIAKLNYKQAIIVAAITAASTIVVTLITSGYFGQKQPSPELTDCSYLENKVDQLEAEKDSKMDPVTIAAMSNRYFKRGANKNEILDSIQTLINNSNTLIDHQAHYLYKLFLINKIMLSNPRGHINTKRQHDKKETYVMIQEMLNELDYYSGSIDGDRQRTFAALKLFQEKMNRIDSGYFNPKDYGIFGNKTLVTIRSLYERQQN